ncbi:oxygenase MpaB family protein [Microbulbifer sp. ALW1]|uniref:oxygenase MpaB family protein n=1 Tax=Microbulbifer sp. (strain ALW1) TaxID=1516059 RepID=UPI001357A913|nr:oxygenase MpaB family protein [Microbulbifer sp. ALW1]
MLRRKRIRREIDRLNPFADHCEIVHLIVCDGFLWDFNRALELALFRTFASPSISGLLERTGEFTRNGQKRYDDTSLLMLQLLRYGYDSVEGNAALARMNRTHGHFAIANRDYLFVLSTFILDPIDWIQRFGWRRLTDKEQESLFLFWYRVGERMGISDIPESLTALRDFSEQYVREQFRFSNANRSVSDGTFGVVESWLPRPLRHFVRPVSAVLLDEATRAAVKLPAPNRFYRSIVPGALKLRAKWLAFFGRSGEPAWPDGYRSYPQGYTIETLAPKRILEVEQQASNSRKNPTDRETVE